ncbi:hypothetical protein P7B02_11650 [Caulobacter segnis]|uniref:hypothetical protein n=1 Tax=Caulobacter segnis TaxID=88688 RepID=UPI00240F85FF|nr:hypothetical protein [Caulobacter segnis]MDG2522196.1 hypothetical protein [Caulobacter segnis]
MAKDDASENMVLRTVYLPKALDKQLRAIAFEVELSKGELMRVLIAEAMQHRAAKGEAAFEREGAPTPRPVVVVAPPPPPPALPEPAPVIEPVKAAKPRPPKPAPEPKAPDTSQSSIFDFL